MTPSEAKTYSDYLSNAAATIATGRSLPLDMEDICNDLGLQISNNADASKTTLGLRGKKLVISLNPLRHPALYRFHVAHEIGHALLLREFSALPLGESEYWQHENLCNFFAQRLLLPDAALARLDSNNFQNAKSALLEIHRLAMQHGVPTCDVVAVRCRDRFPSIGVFEISPPPVIREQASPDDSSESPRFKVIFSNLPGKKAIGTIIDSTMPLSSILKQFKRIKLHRELDGKMILCALFPKLDSQLYACTTSAYGMRVLQGKIRIVVSSNFFEQFV